MSPRLTPAGAPVAPVRLDSLPLGAAFRFLHSGVLGHVLGGAEGRVLDEVCSHAPGELVVPLGPDETDLLLRAAMRGRVAAATTEAAQRLQLALAVQAAAAALDAYTPAPTDLTFARYLAALETQGQADVALGQNAVARWSNLRAYRLAERAHQIAVAAASAEAPAWTP